MLGEVNPVAVCEQLFELAPCCAVQAARAAGPRGPAACAATARSNGTELPFIVI
jgi:hypothetical protein